MQWRQVFKPLIQDSCCTDPDSFCCLLRCPHDCPYSEDTPLYRPVDWEVTERILERTVAYSLNINTSDSQLDAMIGAVTTAAKAAL